MTNIGPNLTNIGLNLTNIGHTSTNIGVNFTNTDFTITNLGHTSTNLGPSRGQKNINKTHGGPNLTNSGLAIIATVVIGIKEGSNSNNNNDIRILRNNISSLSADLYPNVILNEDPDIKNKELVEESCVNIFFYDNYLKHLFNLHAASNNSAINTIEQKEGDDRNADKNLKNKNIV
ncbi:hypothetical protein PFDG_05159 [Plasmodium falciparum Dd2]|uniref:Uncharacterized protein n=1 Tax=Plasmodium falciparum (isolate Dd2) TaxID=57267 RepID=A0A0L7MAH5_PLAF4|nr:hypothetical protein PFDG_05159 [Plasmodium falciparum Dd2]